MSEREREIARTPQTCDACRRRRVTTDDYCFGCHRAICVRCALTRGHYAGGEHR